LIGLLFKSAYCEGVTPPGTLFKDFLLTASLWRFVPWKKPSAPSKS